MNKTIENNLHALLVWFGLNKNLHTFTHTSIATETSKQIEKKEAAEKIKSISAKRVIVFLIYFVSFFFIKSKFCMCMSLCVCESEWCEFRQSIGIVVDYSRFVLVGFSEAHTQTCIYTAVWELFAWVWGTETAD